MDLKLNKKLIHSNLKENSTYLLSQEKCILQFEYR